MPDVRIIAEIGVNHNGSLEMARQLVRAAHECGADAVKFQTFSAERLAGPDTPKVPYQLRSGPAAESHFEMLKKLELSPEAHREMAAFCREVGITFCSTPYSRKDAEFLQALGVPFFKVASADLVDRELHEYIAASGKDSLIAVGMATMEEIKETLALYEKAGARDRVVLLHCVSAYPAPDSELNLRALTTLRSAFGCRIGYSDHSGSAFPAAAAVALGASVVEKHFTLDRNLPGPDHAASSDPAQFREFVRAVRSVESSLGDGSKRVMPSETEMRRVSRKSIVAVRDLKSKCIVTREDVTFRRPGTGISPMRYPEIIGKRLVRDVECGDPLAWSDVTDA